MTGGGASGKRIPTKADLRSLLPAVNGLTNVSIHTVRSHVKAIFAKVDAAGG